LIFLGDLNVEYIFKTSTYNKIVLKCWKTKKKKNQFLERNNRIFWKGEVKIFRNVVVSLQRKAEAFHIKLMVELEYALRNSNHVQHIYCTSQMIFIVIAHIFHYIIQFCEYTFQCENRKVVAFLMFSKLHSALFCPAMQTSR
jgi:hypothetical protein